MNSECNASIKNQLLQLLLLILFCFKIAKLIAAEICQQREFYTAKKREYVLTQHFNVTVISLMSSDAANHSPQNDVFHVSIRHFVKIAAIHRALFTILFQRNLF